MSDQVSFRAITATAATATQDSVALSNPKGKALLTRLNVTAGTTLSLAVAMIAIFEDGTENVIHLSPFVVTGVAVQLAGWMPLLVTLLSPALTFQTLTPPIYKLRVVHSNANAATYTLDVILI